MGGKRLPPVHRDGPMNSAAKAFPDTHRAYVWHVPLLCLRLDGADELHRAEDEVEPGGKLCISE